MIQFGRQNSSDLHAGNRVKSWVRHAFDLSEDASVLVSELHCTEPGCVPVETVIALMGTGGSAPRTFKVFKPLAEVAESDIAALIAKTD
jgi:nitrate reductase delta subunit